jgi:hypothetical protein
VPADFTPEFSDWRDRPERSAAAAALGIILCWMLAGYLALNMVAVTADAATVDGREFIAWMGAPALMGTTLCASRRLRFLAGAVVPGFIAGWVLGWAPIVLILAISTLT